MKEQFYIKYAPFIATTALALSGAIVWGVIIKILIWAFGDCA